MMDNIWDILAENLAESSGMHKYFKFIFITLYNYIAPGSMNDNLSGPRGCAVLKQKMVN